MTNDQNKSPFSVPAYRGGERRNGEQGSEAGNSEDRLYESSGNVPGTARNTPVPRSPTLYTGTEERGTPSTRRKPYRVQARASEWGNADGTIDQLVKLYGGTRGSIAIDYDEISRLIAELARLQYEHQQARKATNPCT